MATNMSLGCGLVPSNSKAEDLTICRSPLTEPMIRWFWMLIRAVMCGMYRLLLMGCESEGERCRCSMRFFQKVYLEKMELWKQSFFQFKDPTKSKLAIMVEVDTSQTLYLPSVE